MNVTGRREVMVTQLVFIIIVGFACYFSPITYVRFIAEDYWGEYGTWAAFIVAAALFGASFGLARGDWLARIWYFLLAFACFFVAMEEISWGQRILGLSMPEAVARLNNQHELTFHNLIMVERVTPYNTVVPAAVLGYGVLIALASSLVGPVKRFLSRLRVVYPPLYLAPTFLLSAYLMTAPIEKSSELGELLAGIGMALLAADRTHRLIGNRPPTPRLRRWLLGGFVCLLAMCLIGGYWLAPALIEAAYSGESFDVFNNALTGRSIHPLEKYLAKWAVVRRLGLGLLVIAAVVAAPFVRRLWSSTEEGSWMTRITGPILVMSILSAGLLVTESTGQKVSFGHELNALADRVAVSGDYDRAASILSYIEAYSLAPRADVLYRRALVYRGSGRDDEANALFEEALLLESAASREARSASRSQRLGEISARLGRPQDAERHWMEALAQYDEALAEADSNEDLTQAYLGRAATYRLRKYHNAAITEYVRASTVAVLGFRKKQIWLGIGEVLAECQPEELRKGPRWDFGVHWGRVQNMKAALENENEPDWCRRKW